MTITHSINGLRRLRLFKMSNQMKRTEVKVDIKINVAHIIWALTFLLSFLLR